MIDDKPKKKRSGFQIFDDNYQLIMIVMLVILVLNYLSFPAIIIQQNDNLAKKIDANAIVRSEENGALIKDTKENITSVINVTQALVKHIIEDRNSRNLLADQRFNITDDRMDDMQSDLDAIKTALHLNATQH